MELRDPPPPPTPGIPFKVPFSLLWGMNQWSWIPPPASPCAFRFVSEAFMGLVDREEAELPSPAMEMPSPRPAIPLRGGGVSFLFFFFFRRPCAGLV